LSQQPRTAQLALAVLLFLAFAVSAQSDPEPKSARERFALHHTMEYEYDRPVILAPHIVRLLPQSWTPGIITQRELRIQCDGTHTLRQQLDLENNLVAGIWFKGETKRLIVQNRLVLDIPFPEPPLDIRPEARASAFPVQYLDEERKRLAPFLDVGNNTGPKFTQFVESLPKEQGSAVGWLGDVNRRICDKVAYFQRLEEGVLSPESTLERGGTCRDFAWLLVQVLRKKGVAARFVSGYQIPPEALKNRDSKVYPGELHAWVEVFLPGAGWVGLDPTAGKWTTSAYIPLVATATTGDAGPLQGTFAVTPPMPGVFAKSTLKFKITVQRLDGPEPPK
jgi:transglutaminase-like putative cysteine protease